MALVEKSPFEFEADARAKRQRRFGEAVDGAHGPAGLGRRADRGAVSIGFDRTSNHRGMGGELRFGVAFRARRRRRIGLSPRAGFDPDWKRARARFRVQARFQCSETDVAGLRAPAR